MNEKEITKIVLEELEIMGFLKKKNKTFQNTELILYNYKKIEESIKQRKDQIKELKKCGLPKKSKSITSIEISGLKIEENDLLDSTIKNIEKSIIKTEVTLNFINKIIQKFANDPYFEIIKLKYFEEKTEEQIAEYFQRDISTINRNKNRLINNIKTYLLPNDLITDLLGY